MNTAGQFTVLIIDDKLTNLLILGKTLEKSGYEVIKATNGTEGRELAEQYKPELILLDIMMPGEDGFETIQKLKSNSVTHSIPVIFLTAVDDVDAKIKGFELGAVDFIIKPFHPAEVNVRVKLHIRLNIATNALINSQREKLKQIETAQLALMVQPEELPDAKFAKYYLALEEAGGDFYDVFHIGDATYGYFLGDVSGHDIATGFITASLKALLKQNCQQIYDPTESMRMVNEVLLEVLPSGKYLTATYLNLDRRENVARLVCMGHPPVVYHPLNGSPRMIESQGDILGVFPDVLYKEVQINVLPGDRFYMYSDGLIETDTVWSANTDRLLEVVSSFEGGSLEESVNYLKQKALPDGVQPEDDVVIVAVEV